jgi:hypothetical protein
MNNLFIAILIGLAAGLIDVIPMVVQKISVKECVSAFVHYFMLGIIIPFVDWGIPAYFTGIVISLGSAIPIMILVYQKDKKAIIPMFIFSIILGAGIGYAGAELIA